MNEGLTYSVPGCESAKCQRAEALFVTLWQAVALWVVRCTAPVSVPSLCMCTSEVCWALPLYASCQSVAHPAGLMPPAPPVPSAFSGSVLSPWLSSTTPTINDVLLIK